MSRAEKFISDCTRNCSNYTGVINKKTYEGYYVPWLTPDEARRAVEIAREETIKEVCEWLDNHNDYICGGTNGISMYDMDKLIEDLKKYFEGEVCDIR